MLDRLTEKRQDVKEWERRLNASEKRVRDYIDNPNGKYEYTEPQDEEDGLSAASILDELACQQKELRQMEESFR